MKNFIGLNISFLCEREKLSQKEFGELFDLKKNVISAYIREKTNPQVDTLQKIGKEFNISLDDFINRPLDQVQEGSQTATADPPATYEVETLQQKIEYLEKINELLERENAHLRWEDTRGGRIKTA